MELYLLAYTLFHYKQSSLANLEKMSSALMKKVLENQIAGNELKTQSAALLQTDTFDFNSAKNEHDRNLLICGDNLAVMRSLSDESIVRERKK